MTNIINNEDELNKGPIDNIEDNSQDIEKKKTTLGIRTTEDIKKFFEQDIEGNTADEKIRNLKLAYEKMKALENSQNTEITSYINNIESILSSVSVQLVAIDDLFHRKEKQIREGYSELIDRNFKEIQDELENIEELNIKIDTLSTDKKTLTSELKEKNELNSKLKAQNDEISASLNDKNKVISKLEKENIELLKKVNSYMELVETKSKEYETELNNLKNSYKDLDIANTIKEHKIDTLEKENIALKQELKNEKEELKSEIKEISKEYKDEIKSLNEAINNKNLEIESLNRKILELELKNK